jgi:hypothetical protein
MALYKKRAYKIERPPADAEESDDEPGPSAIAFRNIRST